MNPLTNWWGAIRDAYANRYQPEGVRVLAYFYWYTLLILTTLVILIAALYGYWQFKIIVSNSGVPEAIPEGATKPPITKEELKMILQGFEDRRGAYETLRQTPPKISDPSR